MLVLCAIFLTLAVGCTRTTEPSPLRVFAAASTSEAVSEVVASFEAQEAVTTQVSFAGTSTLGRQILSGAKADVFLSANVAWVHALETHGLVGKQQPNYVTNVLAVVTRAEGDRWVPRRLEDLQDRRLSRIAIAEPESVPAGVYARRAMEGAGVWREVAPKCVYSTNVRHVLGQVETGAADAGVVYRTDAAVSEKVTMAFEIPGHLTGTIGYGLVLTREGVNDPVALRFFDAMNSSAGRQAFLRRGFSSTLGVGN
ncbi:MAG: molybdate ABC transporter substrate-binding protein [Myxococcota bacterium]